MNNWKLLTIAFGAVALALTLWGCPSEQVSQSSSGQIESKPEAVAPDDPKSTRQLTSKPEVVEEVDEDGPRTTVGDEMRAAEEASQNRAVESSRSDVETPNSAVRAMMVGRWGRIMIGAEAVAEMSYSEISFLADGTYVWTDRAWGTKFQKKGIYWAEGNEIALKDTAMIHSEDPSIDTTNKSGHFGEYRLTSGRTQNKKLPALMSTDEHHGWVKGICWDFERQHYYDELGRLVDQNEL